MIFRGSESNEVEGRVWSKREEKDPAQETEKGQPGTGEEDRECVEGTVCGEGKESAGL